MSIRYTLANTIFAVLFSLSFASSGHAADAILQPTMQSFEQYTRIQIPVSSGSTFSLMSGSGDSKIILQKVRPESLQALLALADGRVKSVAVNKLGLDQAEINLKFQQSGIDSFAYLQGSVLVIDLWQKTAGESSAEAQTQVAKIKTKTSKPVALKKVASRKIASAEQPKAEPAFQPIEPLKWNEGIFQKFVLPIPEMMEAKGQIISLPPKVDIDDIWKFPAKKASTDEEKAFEFAKKLYAQKKYGLATKTIEISRREFPKNPLAAQLDLLEAFCYRRLGESTKTKELIEKADQMLTVLASRKDEKGNPLPFSTPIRLFFGQKLYLDQNWFEALSGLEQVAEEMDHSNKDYPYLQFLIADCYLRVNQPRRAERIYRYLVEHHAKSILAKEAAYRISAILASEKNYARAAESGEAALELYPEYEKFRSEVTFNIAESYFWLEKFSAAEKFFKHYLAKNSSKTISALAWVRLGEISELAKKDLNAARESYLQAKNGYPFSPGDLVASIRLARIDLNVEKEPEFVLKSMQEILKDKAVDPDQRRAAEIVMVDYLLKVGNTNEAIEIARLGVRDNIGKFLEPYKLAYTKSMFKKFSNLVAEKKFPQALALYNGEKKWIDAFGPEALKVGSDMYRGLGLYSTSNEKMERYAAEIRGMKGRYLASHSSDRELDLVRAKNSFARGNYNDVLSTISEQQNVDSIYMRAVSEYRLGRKRDSYKSAELALLEFKKEKEKVSDEMIEEVAEILIDRDDKVRDYANMEKTLNALSGLAKRENPRITFTRADAIWYQKRHQEATVAYQEAILNFPKGERAERAKYNIGMSQIALGKREDAVRTLTELRDSSKSVWAESAQRELDLIEWEKKYSSVLKTLPPSGLGILN